MTVIISILLVVITFLLYKIFYLKRENIVKEIKKNAIILDKTGTITEGKPSVEKPRKTE